MLRVLVSTEMSLLVVVPILVNACVILTVSALVGDCLVKAFETETDDGA